MSFVLAWAHYEYAIYHIQGYARSLSARWDIIYKKARLVDGQPKDWLGGKDVDIWIVFF